MPRMSVNWSCTNRMPFAFARSIFSLPSTTSAVITTDVCLRSGPVRPPGIFGRAFCACCTNRARYIGYPQDSRCRAAIGASSGTSALFFLHKTERKRQREPKLRIVQPPARQRLDPAHPIGDRVAMDPKRTRRIGETGLLEYRTQRGEAL